MIVLITGATGFLGSHIARLAAERGLDVRAMARETSDRSEIESISRVEIVTADLTDADSLARAVRGVGAVVHCAATTSQGRPDLAKSRAANVEGTRALAEAAAVAGARRWIQISSMSAHEGSTSVYGRTKLEADLAVKAADLDWTILRPSIIYGPGERGVVAKTARLMKKLPVMPVVGSGAQLMRPVLAADVARAALDCLEATPTIGRTYMIGGAEEVTFDQFLRRLGEASGARKPLVHLPMWLSMLIARALAAISADPPLTVDNVLGVKEARRVDIEPARREFGFEAKGFAEGLAEVYGG